MLVAQETFREVGKEEIGPQSWREYPSYRYPLERQRIIEWVRKGRTPESLAEKFEPSAQTIRNWLAQAESDAGQRTDGLTTAEREESPPVTTGEHWSHQSSRSSL